MNDIGLPVGLMLGLASGPRFGEVAEVPHGRVFAILGGATSRTCVRGFKHIHLYTAV
jgi:hypothetical protein